MNIDGGKVNDPLERPVQHRQLARLVAPGRQKGQIPAVQQRLERQERRQGMPAQPGPHGRASISRSISSGLT